jgi:hypothetical protein
MVSVLIHMNKTYMLMYCVNCMYRVASSDLNALLGPEATAEDIYALSSEIKDVVGHALRHHFARVRGDATELEEAHVHTRVHGTISTGLGASSFDTNDKDPHLGLTPANISLIADEPPKFKSKADRLLGITTDAKTGLAVNDPSASSRSNGSNASNSGGGLFGSIGSLFSSKTGNNQVSGAGRSSKPTIPSGFSSRNDMSVRQDMPAASSRHDTVGTSSRGSVLHNRHALDTIVDEEEDKKSIHRSGKSVDDNATIKSENTGMSAIQKQITAELNAEEIVYRDLMANLVTLVEVKNNVRRELQDWETEFQKKYGRDPTVEDKMSVNERFVAYKMVSMHV